MSEHIPMEKFPSIYDTIALMRTLHKGQTDRAGQPYWLHPLRVMLRLGADAHPVEKHAALLHDTIEDCGVTGLFLARQGYGPRVIHVVNLLTREPGLSYRNYIKRILESDNDWAMRCKLADNYDNAAPGRLPLTDPDLAGYVNERLLPTIAKMEPALRARGLRFPLAGDPPEAAHALRAFWPPAYPHATEVDFVGALETATFCKAFGE